jgi:hypothetical protein
VNNINLRRVLSGGLIAGFFYNGGGITVAILLNLEDTFARFGAEPSLAGGLLHMGVRFGLGIVSVFLYAGIRPRFGPGPNTAILAGILMWFAAYVPGTLVLQQLGVFTGIQTAIAIAWGLMEACIATIAGALVYREEPAS